MCTYRNTEYVKHPPADKQRKKSGGVNDCPDNEIGGYESKCRKMQESLTKSYLMNEYRPTTTLDYFIRVYNMLDNFVEFLELRGFKELSAHFKKVPLQGALEVFSKVTNSCKNLAKQANKRPGLFVDSFRFRFAYCPKSANIPQNAINKIKTVITYLTESSMTKKYSMLVKSILFELSDSPCIPASKKLQILSVLLKDTAENVICGGQVLEEPPAHIQTKTLLNLVSNFIHEWGERARESPCHLKICKFCTNVINDETQQYTKKFCCIKAKHLSQLSNEWLSYTLQDSSRFETICETNCKTISYTRYTPKENASNSKEDTRGYPMDDDSFYTNRERDLDRSVAEDFPMKLTARTEMDDKQYKTEAIRKIGRPEANSDHGKAVHKTRTEAKSPSIAAEKIAREERAEERYRAPRRAIAEEETKKLTARRKKRLEEDKRRPYEKDKKDARLELDEKDRRDKKEGEEEMKEMKEEERKKKLLAIDEKRVDPRKAVPIDTKYQPIDTKTCKTDTNPIKFRLSDKHFSKLGWTLLPVTKTMRKIAQYEVKPAKPNVDWFKKFKDKNTRYYDDDKTPFLNFHPDGSGEVFYPNGVLAVKVYRPENRKYDMYTVFTPGGKDAMGVERESQILAIFDTMGNGVVFDEDGTSRLSYNQVGGIFTDNPPGRPFAWTWNANQHESKLETVYIEKSNRLQMAFVPNFKLTESSGNVETPISPSNLRNKEKKVEVRKPVVGQRQEEVGNKYVRSSDNQNIVEDILHIKIICIALNKFLSLRIIDRKNISLRFSVGNKNIRFELGTIINFNKEIAARMMEASDWKSDMLKCRFQENLLKRLDADSSLYDLSKEYQKVKRVAKDREALIIKYKPFLKLKPVKYSCKFSDE